jgi:hypothetical protein
MSALVGILLPVRIETAFDPHPAGCRLRVLVVPDTPWIDRHDDTVRESELDALDRAWKESAGDFQSDAGLRTFARFASAYGGARAAWLARRFPAVAGADGFRADRTDAKIRQPDDPPRGSVIRGLPDEIEIWAVRANPPPGVPDRVRVITLQLTGKALRIELGGGARAPEPGEEIFTPSWDAAVDAGLAADIELANVGLDPGDITVLYAIGLGEADPRPLFQAHRDFGALSVLATGMPTNTVAGEPAADLARDSASWLRTVRAPDPSGDEALLSVTLTGKPAAIAPLYAPERIAASEPLPPEPRAVLRQDDRAQRLINVLWPALWGANLKDIWGIDAADPDVVFRLGAWASACVQPEGPLPPIRIGDQPYGILPTTSLARWDSAGDAHDIEPRLVANLRIARRRWAARAEAAGTIAGADADKVLSLLERLPVTDRVMCTIHMPLELAQIFMAPNAPPDKILDWWRHEAADALDLRGGDPARAFVQYFEQTELALPLVEPPRPDADAPWAGVPGRSQFASALRWFQRTFDAHLNLGIFDVEQRSSQPQSLLYRLIVHSAIVAASEVVRAGKGLTGPVGAGEGRLSKRFAPGVHPDALGAGIADRMFRRLWESLDALADEDPRVLERSFLATLDAASHRIDPWITGVAWRRLRSAAYQGERRALCAYGWVDRPFRGSRGPTRAGLLLAPSAAQATAAVIMRDKAVYDPAPAAGALPGTHRWDITFDSARVRLATRLAAEVRIGAHIGEVLGREVERIFAAKTAIDTLRDRYRLHDSHQGRRVCDGEKVLAKTPAQLAAETGLVVRPDQAARLSQLRDAIDAYGDLLVADAVFDVVSGRADTAGAAMEAAAGLDLPPEIDVIRTPRSGHAASTVVLAVLPDLDGPAPPGASPVRLAEPAFARYVTSSFPAAAQWRWTREDPVTAADGSTSMVSRSVALSELGLDPLDLVVLDPEQVSGIVIEHTRGVAPGLHPRVRPNGSGPELHARLRRLASIFSGEPALPTRLAAEGQTIPRTGDQNVIDDLWARYLVLHEEALDLRQALDAIAIAVANPTDGGTELARARRWGVVPVVPPETSGPVDQRRDLLRVAVETLDERLKKAPQASPEPAAGLTAERIASAMGELVAPGGRVPVLSRIRRSQIARRRAPVPAATMIAEPFDAMSLDGNPGAGRNRIDRSWLEIVAAVRAPESRIEAYQFEAMVGRWPVLRAWSNWPGNPWRQGIPHERPIDVPPLPPLFVAYGPAQTLDGAGDPSVAAVILDAWVETIPSQEHTVTAAFGFNAPAARAPQSILVAVTPVDGVPLDVSTLLDVVIETRELAHARMATARDLTSLAAALPMTLVPTRYSDRAGLELGTWESQ